MIHTPTPPRHKATPTIANTNTPLAPQTSASLNRRAVSGGKSSTHIPFRVLGEETSRYDTKTQLRTSTNPSTHGKETKSQLRTLPSRLISGSGKRSTIGELVEEKIEEKFQSDRWRGEDREVGEKRKRKREESPMSNRKAANENDDETTSWEASYANR